MIICMQPVALVDNEQIENRTTCERKMIIDKIQAGYKDALKETAL